MSDSDIKSNEGGYDEEFIRNSSSINCVDVDEIVKSTSVDNIKDMSKINKQSTRASNDSSQTL